MVVKILLTAAAAAFAAWSVPAQEVNTWETTRGGVVTSMDEGLVTWDDYAADGIIGDWSSTLKAFLDYEDSGAVDEEIRAYGDEATLVRVTARDGRSFLLPRIVDDDGVDLFQLTRDGIEIYMALDGPVYLQDIDEEIVKWVRFYALQKRSWTHRVFSRYERWEPVIKDAFRAANVPEELAELCLIESGCTAGAVSHAGAVGMWQIMPATGRQYGMVVSDTRDDRRSPELSIPVAARILVDNRRATGDWTLAAAAYNCGAGRVGRSGAGRTWESVRRTLPKETQQYIPSLLAMHYIWVYRKNLGF